MAMDPRIRARRTAVRRAEGRRRLRFLLGALTLVAVAVGAWALTRTALFDLDHVVVEGADGARAREVTAAAALRPGTAMFDLDLGGADAAVTALAWVREARLVRTWPGTVEIRVTPRVAVAAVADGNGRRGRLVVDDEGVVFAGDGAALPAVAIDAAPAEGEVLDGLDTRLAVARAIPDDLRPWIDAVVVGDDAILGIDLVGSATAVLGDDQFLDDKMAALRAVLAGTELACIDVIDVTTADLTTVTRVPGCDPGPDGDGAS